MQKASFERRQKEDDKKSEWKVEEIARVAGGICGRVPWFWRRSRKSLAASPLASRGGSAAKKVPLAQQSCQLGRLERRAPQSDTCLKA